MMKYLFIKISILIALLIMNCVELHAQTLDDPGGDPGGEDVPIDGGITALLAAGIGFATRKLKHRDRSVKISNKL